MYRLFFVSVALAAAAPTSAAVTLDLFGSGFNAPVYLNGRANTLFVVEQGGRIVAVDRGTRAQTTFFTVPNIETGGEKGLLGLAFDPFYKTNGRFYVNVTARVSGQLVSEVRRYTNPAIATEAATVVLRVDQPYENHKAGWIDFAADKTLYVAFGDGGGSNDPQNFAQNKASLLGKILRIDVSGDGFPADPNRNYRIPATNPFASEVFAYGLRNPFRNSIDRTTGDIYIGDVGQGRFEEINRIAAGTSGQNFGWRPLEGTQPTPGVGDPIPPGTVAPLSGYDHSAGDRSITGGYVYRGSGKNSIAELGGRYVFADFISGRLWSMALDGTGRTEFTGASAPFGRLNPSSFGEGGNKELYVLDYGGRVFRIKGTAAAARASGVAPLAAVPEPASWMLLIGGFGMVGTALRRRRTAIG